MTGISSFSPKVAGDYKVQVYRDEKNIKGSPFPVTVHDNELAHASKVKISGALEKAIANESNVLNIDVSEAGKYRYVENTFKNKPNKL